MLNYAYGTVDNLCNYKGDALSILCRFLDKVLTGNHPTAGKSSRRGGGKIGAFCPWGYVDDRETDLYYCQSRYYDPAIGRFINADAFASTGNGVLGDNMFAYCLNNPVKYADRSGFVIVLAAGATEEQIEEYEKAIEYLKTSETAREMIEMLENSSEVFVVVFVDNNEMTYDSGTNTIYFDINSGLILGNMKSVQSPALGLAHEMGHAAQDITGVINEAHGSEYYLEVHNLQTYETPIARELGEPIRNNYFDGSGYMDMQNSTHYRTTYTRPLWHYILFWNLFTPNVIDCNLDN